jgi:hypothetical protein
VFVVQVAVCLLVLCFRFSNYHHLKLHVFGQAVYGVTVMWRDVGQCVGQVVFKFA